MDGNLIEKRDQDKIIEQIVILFLCQHGPGIIFQHDNARPHRARVFHCVFNQNNVNVLPWPANSPDLSPIEHVWCEMERRLRQLPQQPKDLWQLARTLIRVWNDIPQDFHTHVIGSVRRRCTAVINACGGHTWYWLGDFNIFKKILVQLTIWKMSWTSGTSLFLLVICHVWKNTTNCTMHSFFCCRVYNPKNQRLCLLLRLNTIKSRPFWSIRETLITHSATKEITALITWHHYWRTYFPRRRNILGGYPLYQWMKSHTIKRRTHKRGIKFY